MNSQKNKKTYNKNNKLLLMHTIFLFYCFDFFRVMGRCAMSEKNDVASKGKMTGNSKSIQKNPLKHVITNFLELLIYKKFKHLFSIIFKRK